MAVKKAIKPEKLFFNLPTLVKDKEAEKKGVTVEERTLGALANSSGWQVLSEFIDNIVSDLDNVNEVAISQGASFAEIGRNTVVINLAKGVIKKIVDKVNDAREVCEQATEGKWARNGSPWL